MFTSSDLSLERFEEECKNAYIITFLSKGNMEDKQK